MTRITNLFHMVNNLAEWAFFCRKQYNVAWIEETGPITPVERQALDRYAEIAHSNPPGSPSWPEKPFVLADGEAAAWDLAYKLLGNDDASELKNVLSTLEPRFDRVWDADKPRLADLATIFDTELQGEAVSEVVTLLATYLKSQRPETTIHLLMSRGESVGGGANAGAGHVTLEGLGSKSLLPLVEVVLHEVTHLMEANSFLPMYEEFSAEHGLKSRDGGFDAHHLLREAMTGSLLPGGCLSPVLGERQFDHPKMAAKAQEQGNEQDAALLKLTGRCLPFVESYITNGKPVDRELLEAVYREIKGLLPQ